MESFDAGSLSKLFCTVLYIQKLQLLLCLSYFSIEILSVMYNFVDITHPVNIFMVILNL